MEKYNYGNRKSSYGSFSENENKNLFYGVVISDKDEKGTGNLKIRIKGVDDNIDDIDLPNSFPLLPKFINIYPKVGESVLVFTFTNIKKDRLWLGPITSQNQTLRYNDGLTTALSGFDFGPVAPKKNLEILPENKGSYPTKNEIAIQGRVNSDILLGDNTLTLRCGKIDLNDPKYVKYNKTNPSYIQIKHSLNLFDKDGKENKNQGVINLVSNKINFLTYNSKLKNYDLTNQDNLISDEVLNDILKDAQEMVYGRNLLDFLKLFIKAFVSHVHPYNGDVAENLDRETSIDDLLNYDLNTLLNSNLKSN